MKPIWIFRHTAGEGPGYLADFLDRHGLPYRLIKVDEHEPVPDSIEDTPGLVFMGGPMSVNDELPWIPKALKLIRTAVAADRPVLGHCLGGQLLSKALGGTVTRNPVKEIGWLPVERVDGPQARDWLNGLEARFNAFHWHGETFSLPAGAELILKSRDCTHQAFVIGKSLGLQCHVEMTAAMVRDWARTGAEETARTCATIQNADQLTADLDQRVARLQSSADVLYSRWIRGLS
jgi:GMP synthase-like glutamine amidotransferase